MALPTQTFTQYVNNLTSGWASQVGISPALVSGDPLLAIMQSVASQLIWLQFLVTAVNNFARASTSTGSDLDSWMADFNFIRLAAQASTGTEVFGVNQVRTVPVTIPIGAIVQTIGGVVQYQTVADITNSNYNSTTNSYTLTVGSTGVNVTVVSLTVGTSANVVANQLNQLGTTVPGIDFVNNTSAISTGTNPEIDQAFRTRFVNYLAGLGKGTKTAVQSALALTTGVMAYNTVENLTIAGSAATGYFLSVVDDGSGSPPSSLVTLAQNSVDLVRAFTIQQNAYGPTKLTATIVCNIRISSTAVTGTETTLAQTAIVNFVNALTIGQTLYLSKLAETAIDADPTNILSVQLSTLTVNGSGGDLTAAFNNVIRTSTSSVTISTY